MMSSEKEARSSCATQGVLDFRGSANGTSEKARLIRGSVQALPFAKSKNGDVENRPKPSDLTLTSKAASLLTEKSRAYRVNLLSMSRSLAADQQLETVSLVHVEKASVILDVEGKPEKKYYGVVGGVLAGAALSNLFEILTGLELSGEEGAPAPILGVSLVIFLLLGVSGIALDLIKRR